ncbi:WNK3 kinase, partial [Polyodon spathula]|nr:WNK3 kinase [Polyodon spathula]
SPAQPSSVPESDGEGPPKMDFVDNRIKTLDEKLRNLLYPEHSGTGAPASPVVPLTTSEEGPGGEEATAGLETPPDSKPSSSSSSRSSSCSDLAAVGASQGSEVTEVTQLSGGGGAVLQDPAPAEGQAVDLAGPSQPTVNPLPPLCSFSCPLFDRDGPSAVVRTLPVEPAVFVNGGSPEHNVGLEETGGSLEFTGDSSELEKTVGRFSVRRTLGLQQQNLGPSPGPPGETDSSSITPEQDSESRSPSSSSSSSSPSGGWASPVQPSLDRRSPPRACPPQQEQGTSSSPLSSDEESDDLRRELHTLREKHIQEVVTLQAQQNRELQQLYVQLRQLKGCKDPPVPHGLPLQCLSPRRTRSAKGKLRSRPQSITQNDNGVLNSTGKSYYYYYYYLADAFIPGPVMCSNANACQEGSANKKGTFTDELHKLVDDWTKETVGTAHTKPSLNQIKQIQQKQEIGIWSKPPEVSCQL